MRLRQPARDRSGTRRAAAGPELAAARAARPVRRSALRQRLHRAARREPEQLALQAAAIGDARAVPAYGQRPLTQRTVQRGRDATQSAALGAAANRRVARRLRPRPRHHRRQRRASGAVGRRSARLPGESFHGAHLRLQRRRADDGAAARPAAAVHRARETDTGTGRDRRRAARREVPGRALGKAGARLRVRELRRAVPPARARAARLTGVGAAARLPCSSSRV